MHIYIYICVYMPQCLLSLVFFTCAFFHNYLILVLLGLRCCMGFSVVVASGDQSLVAGMGFSLQWLLLLQSTGSGLCRLRQLQHTGSVVGAPGV